MTIYSLPALKDNFIYVLAGADGTCAVIDPGEAKPVEKFLDHKRLRLTRILCTHHHGDHIDGINDLLRVSTAEVWCSGYDRKRIPQAIRSLENGDKVIIAGETMEVLSVPGHTHGQIAFYFSSSAALFTGDTLFSGGCGRLFEGTPEDMFQSLQKIKRLPAATQIYFGHEYTLRNLEFIKHHLGTVPEELFDYEQRCRENLRRGRPTTPTTLAEELKINPFLQADDLKTFSLWRERRNHW